IANLTWKAQGQAATRGATMQGRTNAGIIMSSGLGQMANNWPQQQVNTNTSFQNTMDAVGQSQYMNPNYQFGQGNQWQPTYGGWNNTMPQYKPSNLYGSVGASGRTTFPGYQEMGGFASKKGISVSEMYENIRLKKKSSIGQYQEGGFADKTPPNPYPQGSEEARLWEVYTSQNLRPSDSALIASGNVRNESGFESSYEFATSGMPSEELRRVLSEIDQNKGRDRYGVETSSYTDAQGRNVEMEMSQFRGVPITNISESADSSVLTFKQGSKDGDTKYTGRFYEPSLIPEGLTFDSFGKAEAFVSSLISNVQGNGEIPVLEVNRKGGKYTVTQHRKVISNVLPSSGKARSAEELAFLKSMGLDPKDE